MRSAHHVIIVIALSAAIAGCGSGAPVDQTVEPPSLQVQVTCTEHWLDASGAAGRALLIDTPFNKVQITVDEQPEGGTLTFTPLYIKEGVQVYTPTGNTAGLRQAGTWDTVFTVISPRTHCLPGHYVLTILPYVETSVIDSGYYPLPNQSRTVELDITDTQHATATAAVETSCIKFPGD